MSAPGTIRFVAPSKPAEPIQPSADEARNGWTAEALGRYVAERSAVAEERILFRKPAPVTRQNSKYSVFKWRRR